METNRRFTILPFPQYFDGNILKLNILFLPRNQNPLNSAIEMHPIIPDAPSLADAQLSFTAKITSGLDKFPMNVNLADTIPLNMVNPSPADKNALFTELAGQFSISNLNQVNSNLNITSSDKAPDPIKKEEIDRTVSKYLPLTYRKSFNFVSPRVRNAKIDDSYHCAIRNAQKQPGFIMSPDIISWGKVFAFALRQPLIAEKLGILYRTELPVNETWFTEGGWLYIDIADGSDFFTQQSANETGIINNTINEDTDGLFIKKYAARIPSLKMGTERNVFAPVLFPVLFRKPADAADPVPHGNFDNVFTEVSEYDDGYAKIVHSFQPVSHNFLAEESDGFHPTKDTGIRLGWDDEQILIWYIRQMVEDESAGAGKRLDAPLGVFGYKIDVRKKGEVNWTSLNEVKNKVPLVIGNYQLPDFNDEMSYQVYPSQLDGDKNKSYWLPAYFANWKGKSMVLPDEDAITIYRNDKDVQPDPANSPNNETGTGVTGPAQANLIKIYEPSVPLPDLRYGNIYELQIRMSDLTGGGPEVNTPPVHEGPSPVAECHFKRYIAPDTVRIDDIPVNNDDLVYDKDEIVVKRPLLGYPSVVYTGKYDDPVTLLKQASEDMVGKAAFGIADPDVEKVEITVELAALKLDNLMSVSGKEAYIKFYTTSRSFPAGFEDELTIPLEFKDCNVLKFGDTMNLGDLGFTQPELDSMTQLVLPTARNIRLTIRALCKEENGYYGLESTNPEFNTRYGRTRYITLYKPSSDERNLFAASSAASIIKGIYLQPDPPKQILEFNVTDILAGKQIEKMPDIIQRLAQALKLKNTGLTLHPAKGERYQFGCSNRIRHTLAPDNSSITFAGNGDLMNHWLCCLTIQIDRDWTWDAIEDRSFIITRKKKFKKQPDAESEILEIGDIEVKKTISINALHNPDRSHTTLVFIDAVEPKNDPEFPDMIEVAYTIETKFKTGHAEQKDENLTTPLLELPVTNVPEQLPQIASAGIALSPYIRNEKYSATEPRSRYLWIEFTEPIKDPNDLYFARVLAYSPDQLISNNHPSLLLPPEEPSLPVDPEYIRIITPGQSDDMAGIDAMQPMIKSTDSDKHYILPLPDGLHSESPELFGFFTYEFRVGHAFIWSTAQGRFGRALRATGVQHPAPTLTCVVNRDEEKLYVTAPYAVAVHRGKNVTANPPRTELWCLLYAQVRMADNNDNRNILLDDRKMDWRVKVQHKKDVRWADLYNDIQVNTLKYISLSNWKSELDYGTIKQNLKLTDFTFINKDSTKYGTVIWNSSEISQLLNIYGLPGDVSLSVLCVEVFGNITNIHDHIDSLSNDEVRTNLSNISSAGVPGQEEFASRTAASTVYAVAQVKPLSDHLGNFRILRTSPLAEVPFVCCTSCD